MRIKFLLISFLALFCTALLCADTSAADFSSRTEWGARDVSYYSGDDTGYHRSISGATWYYYEIPKSNNYSDDDRLYVPFNEEYTEKVAIPAKTCQSYGGFWVLMRNEYRRDANDDTKGSIIGRPAAAIRLSDIYTKDFQGTTNHILYKEFPELDKNADSPDSSDGVKVTGYGTMSGVLADFTKMQDTTAIPTGAKWEPDSSLSYFCYGTSSPDARDFDTFSTVTLGENFTSAPVVDGQGYLSSSYVVTAGSTIKITFRHYIAKSVENQLGSSSLSYSINGSADSLSTTALNERFNIGSINYYAGVIERTIEVAPTSRQTYCEAIEANTNGQRYSLSNFAIISGGSAKRSSACVTVEPVATSLEVVSSCEQGGDSKFLNTGVIGNTAATAGISKNGVLSVTTAAGRDDTTKVYTKPGDVIQFSYALCFGAHNVGGSLTGNAVRNDISNIQWNIFKVYAGLAGSPEESQEYLFGRAEELLDQEIYVLNYDIRNRIMSHKSLLKGGSLSSPVNDQQYYNIDNSKRQIFFASPDDWPGSIGYAPVVTGATLSQTLEYSNVQVWPEYLKNSRGMYTGPFNKDESEWGWGNIKQKGAGENYDSAYQAYQNGYTSTDKTVRWFFSDEEIYKTVSAVTPYNFDTNITAEINGYSNGLVQSGDVVTISANVDIIPRVNPLTSDTNDSGEFVPYATATPDNTRVELIQFLVRDTVDINDDKEYVYNDGQAVHEATIKQILNGETDAFQKGTICNMFKGYLGDNLGECFSEVVKGVSNSIENEAERVVGNANNDPKGQMSYYTTNDLTRVVPDVEAGYKYCVAIGINHGDSHGVPGQALSDKPYLDSSGKETDEIYSGQFDDEGKPIKNRANPNFAANGFSVNPTLKTSVKNSWKIAPASCRTVTKSPNFQVWNGGLYSGGDIVSSVTSNTVNTKITANHLQDDVKENRRATNAQYFGSWAEYFVISKGSIAGFASASALGYTSPFTFKTTDGVVQTGYFAATGFGGNTYVDNDSGQPILQTSFCDLAHLTIANINCSSGKENGNYASGVTDEAALASFKNRIINSVRLEDGNIEHQKYEGSHTIDAPIFRDYGAGTLVIEVTGHLFIDQNICLGPGICEETSGNISAWESVYAQNSNNLSLFNRNNTTIASDAQALMDLPQIIIIAKDISISSRVSQIDAWLITDSDDADYSGGYINTCKEFESGSTGTSTCWKTLKFNGPVITAALFLNRTGGAWPGFAGDVGNPAYDVLSKEMEDYIKENVSNILNDPNHPTYLEAAEACQNNKNKTKCIETRVPKIVKETFLTYRADGTTERSEAERKAYENANNFSANKESVSVNNSASRDLTCDGSITPAEIFDLHPLTYLWAYGQALKSNQAIITYAQEFAPRY